MYITVFRYYQWEKGVYLQNAATPGGGTGKSGKGQGELLAEYQATQQKLDHFAAQMKAPLTAIGVERAFNNLDACRL